LGDAPKSLEMWLKSAYIRLSPRWIDALGISR
jgi:hypothetical protein